MSDGFSRYASDLSVVIQRMQRVIKPSGVGWLWQSNELLAGKQPIELIKAGETDKVLALLDALAEGVVM